MKLRRFAIPLAALFIVLGVATDANAAAPADKPVVLASWTQPTTASYNAWNSARRCVTTVRTMTIAAVENPRRYGVEAIEPLARIPRQ